MALAYCRLLMDWRLFSFELICLEIFHANMNRPWLLKLCVYLLLNRQVNMQVHSLMCLVFLPSN